MMDLNNSDLRAWWPFLIVFISLYGFIFSLAYSISGLTFHENHKKYTLFVASTIITIYSLLRFLPKNIWLLNLMKFETFYSISIILLSIHLFVLLAWNLKKLLAKWGRCTH